MPAPKQFQHGETLTVRVISRSVVTYAFGRQYDQPVEHLMVADDRARQAFHLVNCGWNPEAREGDTGTITMQTSGHWLYEPHTRARAQEAKSDLLLPGRDF